MGVLDVQPFITQWMHSCLLDRCQRVKINNIASSRTTLIGGMPQGTWFSPNISLIHIDYLQTTLSAIKLIDDVTVIELHD